MLEKGWKLKRYEICKENDVGGIKFSLGFYKVVGIVFYDGCIWKILLVYK